MDLFTFLRKCFERLTKEQFANMERYLTENQKAVLPPDQRTKKRKPALGEGAPDSPSPQMGMGTPGGPAVKKARLEGPPGMAGRPGFGQPVRPSPLGQVSFAAGDSPGPRPPQPQPAQKAANKVNAEQLDEEFDSIKMAGVDVQEEHRLTGLDGQTDMVRYSSAPQSVLEARGVVKARMAEIGGLFILSFFQAEED